MNALRKAIKYRWNKTHPEIRRKQKNLLISMFGTSWLIGFLGWLAVKFIYQIFHLPTSVNSNATEVFLSLGMSCMLLSGIIYAFSLWSEWKTYPFFYKIRSIIALIFIILFFIMDMWIFSREVIVIFSLF